MKPLEWLKIVYETFGADHPRASMLAVILLGGFLFGAIWQVAARQYQKDLTSSKQTGGTTTTVTTTGDKSPANTGSDNNFSYKDSFPPNQESTKPKKRTGKP